MTGSGLPYSVPHSQVEDPHGTILHESTGKAEGQFAFTSKQSGEYKACFAVRGTLPCGVQKQQAGSGHAWNTTGGYDLRVKPRATALEKSCTCTPGHRPSVRTPPFPHGLLWHTANLSWSPALHA